MPNLVYTSLDYPFVPFTKILSADMNTMFTDISTLLNTTKLNDTNIQVHGLTRVGATSKLAVGTPRALIVNDASGDMGELALGSAFSYVRTNSAGTAFETAVRSAPTTQVFSATGTQTGWLFTISTSSTVAVGDTYTNNAHTYTVLGALTAQTGQVLFVSGPLATTTTGTDTLVRATGAGTSSITFDGTLNVATATYTPPSNILNLRIRAVGAGSGGSSGGTGITGVKGTAGGSTFFGLGLVTCPGGRTGTPPNANLGALTASLGGGLIGVALPGSSGQVGPGSNIWTNGTGIWGAAGPFGGTGSPGSGGGGGGMLTPPGTAGPAGSSGAYAETSISTILASYPYAIGTGGTGGTLGTNGIAGQAGTGGIIIVEENYI